MKNNVTVIIAAAGSGTRMGNTSKPLTKLCGREAILYSLDVFCGCKEVSSIVISVKKEETELYRSLIEKENYGKEILFAQGGTTRQKSVLNAFVTAFNGRKKTKFVAIHDAARPLVTEKYFLDTLETARRFGNAVCAARAKDTFKLSDKKNLIKEHVERECLWHIQTPQIFDTDMFHTALAVAEKTGTEATDESGLVTGAGFLVKLCECGHDNIKLTYPEDVFIAQAIIESRKNSREEQK